MAVAAASQDPVSQEEDLTVNITHRGFERRSRTDLILFCLKDNIEEASEYSRASLFANLYHCTVISKEESLTLWEECHGV